jgi:hypothetical protein
MGWRRAAVGSYDEDGSAETGDGTKIIGRFWYVIRGGFVYQDSYDSCKEARLAAREFDERELAWWAKTDSERASDEGYFAWFMDRCFDRTRQPNEYPEWA